MNKTSSVWPLTGVTENNLTQSATTGKTWDNRLSCSYREAQWRHTRMGSEAGTSAKREGWGGECRRHGGCGAERWRRWGLGGLGVYREGVDAQRTFSSCSPAVSPLLCKQRNLIQLLHSGCVVELLPLPLSPRESCTDDAQWPFVCRWKPHECVSTGPAVYTLTQDGQKQLYGTTTLKKYRGAKTFTNEDHCHC